MIVSFVVATILFLILDHVLPLPVWKYRITQNRMEKSKECLFYMHDFDHDGVSEYISYKKEDKANRYAIKIERFPKLIIEQWNLREKYLEVYPIYGDYDHDLWDELYFFTMNGDSIFLHAIDIRNTSGFMINRQCIYRAPPPKAPGESDYRMIQGNFLDCDDDGYQDLILSFYTGFSLQPRGFLAYSVHRRKVLYENFDMGVAGLGKPQIYLPSSLKKEEAIIYSEFNYAANNYDHEVPLRDDRGWLFALGRQLQFRFPPIPFPPKYSSILMRVVHFNATPYFVVLHNNRSTYRQPSVLYLFTLDGKEVTRRYLPKGVQAVIHVFPAGINDELYLSLADGTLEKLDNRLKPISRRQLHQYLRVLNFSADLDDDGRWEHCFWSWNSLVITDNQLNILAVCEFTESVEGSSVTPALLPDGSGNIFFTNGDEGIMLNFQKNNLAALFSLIRVMLFGFVFYLVAILIHIGYRNKMQFSGFNAYSQISEQGMLLLDERMRILRLNRHASEALGMQPELLLGQPAEKALAEQPQLTAFIARLQETSRTLEEDAKLVAHSGVRNVRLKGLAVKNRLGIKMGYFICMIDLSQSGLSERLQFWGETVQKMAHDIKTPLSSLQLSLQTVQYKINDQDPHFARLVRDEFQMMFSELHRVREMTRSFVKFVKMEEPSRKIVMLPELLQTVKARFKHLLDGGKLAIETDLDPEGLYLYVDPVQMEMVLQILLENAVEAMQAEGRILISSAVCQSMAAGLTDMLEIDFVDDGPGIDPQIAEKIFEPFYTTKKTGNGMGLPIAKKIVQEHGGQIELVMSEAKKTVFRITLPLGRFLPADQNA
ncbi:MAG: hypothetical protein Kow0037_29940 [Calditrichia bacterium]